MLKVSNIKAICSADTYANGCQLNKPDNIKKLQTTVIDSDTAKVSALVQGNFGFFHSVRLTLNRHKTNVVDSYDCNCLEKTQLTTPCRHCIALALSLADQDDAEDLPQADVPEPVQPVVSAGVLPAPTPTCAPVSQPEPAAPVQEPRGMEILFGHHLDAADENGQPLPLYWMPNDTTRVFHPNTGIIGTMGTGKTQFTKSLVTQLYRQQQNNYDGSPLGILIFDYKGDYNASSADFVHAVNARILRPYQLPFNPLAIVAPKNFKPLLPTHTANAFNDTLEKIYPRLGPKQLASLRQCIMKAYEQMGILPDNPSTWKNPAPTFDMVYDIYEKDDTIPKNDVLFSVMQKLKQFQLFERNPYRTTSLYDLLQGVVVIDLSGYDADIQSLIVAITMDLFYAQMHSAGSSATNGVLRKLTKLILVDEADHFMQEDFPSLKKILKEGREFGVGTILSTQYLDHFTTGEDNYARYILTWVVHNVVDLKNKDLGFIFNAGADTASVDQLRTAIRSSDRFQSHVKIGNADTSRIRDKAFFEL